MQSRPTAKYLVICANSPLFNMETAIRKASINDKGIIFEFIKFSEIFDYNLRNQNISYLIASMNAEPAGFLSIHTQLLLHHSDKIAEIQELYVVPEFRGLHVGQSLLKYAISILKLEGINQIEVCTNMARAEAQKFYSANGFIGSHYKYTMN